MAFVQVLIRTRHCGEQARQFSHVQTWLPEVLTLRPFFWLDGCGMSDRGYLVALVTREIFGCSFKVRRLKRAHASERNSSVTASTRQVGGLPRRGAGLRRLGPRHREADLQLGFGEDWPLGRDTILFLSAR